MADSTVVKSKTKNKQKTKTAIMDALSWRCVCMCVCKIFITVAAINALTPANPRIGSKLMHNIILYDGVCVQYVCVCGENVIIIHTSIITVFCLSYLTNTTTPPHMTYNQYTITYTNIKYPLYSY